jgi:ribosome-associated translation inhibitor RaiA
MDSPIRISFHGLDHSDAVEAQVRERLAKLDKMCERITGGRVVVEAEHEGKSNLNAVHRPFRVAIHLNVPGDVLTVSHGEKDPKRHENIDSAIRDSFRAVERLLKTYVERKGSGRQRNARR